MLGRLHKCRSKYARDLTVAQKERSAARTRHSFICKMAAVACIGWGWCLLVSAPWWVTAAAHLCGLQVCGQHSLLSLLLPTCCCKLNSWPYVWSFERFVGNFQKLISGRILIKISMLTYVHTYRTTRINSNFWLVYPSDNTTDIQYKYIQYKKSTVVAFRTVTNWPYLHYVTDLPWAIFYIFHIRISQYLKNILK